MDGAYNMDQAAFRLMNGSVLMNGAHVMDGLASIGLLMNNDPEQLGFVMDLQNIDRQTARAERTARMDGALHMDAGLPLMDGGAYMTGEEQMGGQGLILMDGRYTEEGVVVEELSLAYGADFVDSALVSEDAQISVRPSPVDLIGRGPLMDGSLLMNQGALRLMDGGEMMDGAGVMDGVTPGGVRMDNDTNPLAMSVDAHLVDRNEAVALRRALMDGRLMMNGGFRLMDGSVLMTGRDLMGSPQDQVMDGIYRERGPALDGLLSLTVRRIQNMDGSLLMGGGRVMGGGLLMDGGFPMNGDLRFMDGGVILEEVTA